MLWGNSIDDYAKSLSHYFQQSIDKRQISTTHVIYLSEWVNSEVTLYVELNLKSILRFEFCDLSGIRKQVVWLPGF